MSASSQIKFLKFWFPVILYSGIIFYASSLPNVEIPLTIPFSDKFIHAVEYAILGFLFSRALTGTARVTKQNIFVGATVFCFFYGLTDEFHQSFVLGRTACLSDALADGIGGFLGGIVYLVRNNGINFESKNKKILTESTRDDTDKTF